MDYGLKFTPQNYISELTQIGKNFGQAFKGDPAEQRRLEQEAKQKQLSQVLSTLPPNATHEDMALALRDNFPELALQATERGIADRGKTPSAPPGYRWSADGTRQEPIEGGPADPASIKKATDARTRQSVITAESKNRLGLLRKFQGQYKVIRKDIEAGQYTGVKAAAMGSLGAGKAGQIRRAIDSGADAIIRNLTGAGMAIAEAENYARRYQFSPTDTAETAINKLDALSDELAYMEATTLDPNRTIKLGPDGRPALNARGWAQFDDAPPEESGVNLETGEDPNIAEAKNAIAQGADPEAVKQYLIENGIDPAGLE